MNRRTVFFSATALVLAALALPVPGLTETLPQDGEAWFTNVPVVTQDGKTLRFYEDVMKGKVLLINFFFTDCDNVCPLATANLVRVRDLFGARGDDQVQFVSISLQPEHDTPDVMRAFANKHGADGPGWLFLTGKRDDIELLRQRLGFVDIDPAVDADPEQHLGTVRIANEPMHRWVMGPSLANAEAIVRSINRVLPKFN